MWAFRRGFDVGIVRARLRTAGARDPRIQVSDTHSIRGFRRIHVTAILINLEQLALIVWTLIALSMQMR